MRLGLGLRRRGTLYGDLFDADLGRVDLELVALSTEERHDGGIKQAGRLNFEFAQKAERTAKSGFGGEIRSGGARLRGVLRFFSRGVPLFCLAGCRGKGLPWGEGRWRARDDAERVTSQRKTPDLKITGQGRDRAMTAAGGGGGEKEPF